MATTERRLEEVRELETIWDLSPDEQDEAPAPTKTVDPSRVLFAWVAVLTSILLFQPAPSDPQAVVPVWGELLLIGFWASFFATIFGLGARRGWGMSASAATAGVGMAVAVACVVTDHHTGAWWGYEMAAFTGLGAMSLVARRRRPT
jgi:FtsH-binding integral membrane protein